MDCCKISRRTKKCKRRSDGKILNYQDVLLRKNAAMFADFQ